MRYKIPFIKPNFPDSRELIKDYEAIVASNWFTNFGSYEQRFSRACAEYIGSHVYATTISNCTLGLEAAISILCDPTRKKIIMPSFTFAAGAEAVIRCGFEPLFTDIQKETWQPSISETKRLILEHDEEIAGILLCNVFGVGNQEIDEWEKLAKESNLPMIIDSAAGFGSRYIDSEMVGSRGDCEVFSMHATKPFAIGEGGLVVSKDTDFIEKVRSWQNFGFEADRNVHRIGTNAKLQEINAAIGLHQLSDFESRLRLRHNTLKDYKRLINSDVASYQLNDLESTVPFVSVRLSSPVQALKAQQHLLDNGVEARRYYTPLHRQSILSRYSDGEESLKMTNYISDRVISLPVHDDMSRDDISLVSGLINESIEKYV